MDPDEYVTPENDGTDPEFPWIEYQDEDDYEQDCN